MSKLNNQKLKILYLLKILSEETDDEHSIDLKKITSLLAEYGIPADRKTIYSDLAELRKYGYEIIIERKQRDAVYHMTNRTFQLPELKLLVDSVQSAKFISEKKSADLIKKLEGFASKYEAKKLDRQITVAGRVKTMNESVYYSIDAIHTAIAADKKISFKYAQWSFDKKLVPKKNGEKYIISPWALLCCNDYYYLIGYDSEAEKIKHYRVDKMMSTVVVDKEREGREQYEEKAETDYQTEVFCMYGGERMTVELQAANSMVGVFVDRFGKNTEFSKVDDEHFSASVNVEVSRQFLGWVFALGEDVRITSPKSVVDMMKKEAKRLTKQYK